MAAQLKPIGEQVMVITGASSGIGLATARLAARRGARVVAVARSEGALRELVEGINRSGGQAIYVVADVADANEVEEVARAALEKFGGIDTWVNDAGVSVYGRIEEVSLDDMRRVIDTNFWGMVNGSRTALNQLRTTGGAIINIGSVVSDRAIPMQGIYSASKHAVKGFTDALRMEAEEAGLPVSVTLIKPGAINTPFTRHAKNYMDREPDFPAPVYAPEVVADGILYCAEHPKRDLIIGGGGKVLSAMGHVGKRVADKLMRSKGFIEQQKKDEPPLARRDGLYAANEDLSERGDYEGHTSRSSVYTSAAKHPVLTGAAIVGAGVAIAAMVMGEERRRERNGWRRRGW